MNNKLTKIIAFSLFTLVLARVGAAQSTVDLSLQVAEKSRFFDLFSAAWVEVGQEFGGNPSLDGFFSIADDIEGDYNALMFEPETFDPLNFVEIGGGVDAFPNEPVFSNSYTVTYDDSGATGVGEETFDVIDLSLGFQNDVVVDVLSITNSAFSTDQVDGTVTFFDGVLKFVNVIAETSSTYDFTMVGGPPWTYTGQFVVADNKWSLDIDDGPPAGPAENLRLVWDLNGIVLTPGIIIGDVNCDGAVDLLDVAPFVDAISSGEFNQAADTNEDCEVNLLDVASFVDILSG